MKPDLLPRLFRAAAQAPEETPGPMPFRLEAAVLAHWRPAAIEEEMALLARWFRLAVVGAALIMILGAVWNPPDNSSAAASAVALANYEINTHLPP